MRSGVNDTLRRLTWQDELGRLADDIAELEPSVEEDAALTRALRPKVLELERTIMERVEEALGRVQDRDS